MSTTSLPTVKPRPIVGPVGITERLDDIEDLVGSVDHILGIVTGVSTEAPGTKEFALSDEQLIQVRTLARRLSAIARRHG